MFTGEVKNPLCEFADAMIKERVKHKKSNPCYATMVKLILNSFYGKTIAKDPQSAYVVSNNEEKF